MADERKRVVTTAVEIILQYIHSQAYNCDTEQEIAFGCISNLKHFDYWL